MGNIGWTAVVAVAISVGGLLVCSGVARADDDDTPASTQPGADKSVYNLFNPTPDSQMRDLDPERPDNVDGPYTIDAGHVELEMSFAEYSRDPRDGISQISAAPFDVRIGVLNQADVSISSQPFLYQRQSVGASNFYTHGFGNTSLEWKQNFFGDDGGAVALGAIAELDFPTGTARLGTNHYSGGLLIPLTLNLPGDWEIETDAGVSAERNDDGTGYGSAFVEGVNVSHPIFGDLGGFGEVILTQPYQLQESAQAMCDAGLTYLVNANVQLDCAVQIGLSRGLPQYTVVSGISVRF